MKRIVRLPSPAMVVACLALLIALGGTSYAAIKLPRNSVGAKQLKRNAVTNPKVKNNAITGAKVAGNTLSGADVLESSLGQVPSAENATNATNAGMLDNIDSTGFVRPGSSEAWHEIGAPGEPAFQNAWTNNSVALETTAAFYKDPLDVVHLKGIVTDGSATVFTLPAGYRPSKIGCWAGWRNGAIALICFQPNGIITQAGGSATGAMLLDGLTFRVGS
jgi:hypothetical protein